MATNDFTCYLCRRNDSNFWHEGNGIHSVQCKTCGIYRITEEVALSAGQMRRYFNSSLHILSGVARHYSDIEQPATFSTENIADLVRSVRVPKNVLEQMDSAVLYVSERQKRANEEVQVFFGDDYPRAFAHDGEEFRFILDTLVERNYLHHRGPSQGRNNQFYRLTPEGWEKVDELRRVQPDSDQAFVAMWFADKLTQAWREGFKPALESTGYTPIRIDAVEHNDKIDDLIVAEIRRSGLLVADFTGQRGGVYFEAGFAMGLGIPVIWTCRADHIEGVHFDTRQYNHIVWDTPEDLREKLQYRIAATIPGRTIHT